MTLTASLPGFIWAVALVTTNSTAKTSPTTGGRGVEDTRVTFKGVAGLRLGQAVSLEGQYIDFGTAEDGGNRVEATGFTAGIVLHIPAFRYVHPYGKAGVLFWDADGTFNNLSSKEEGNDFTYGGGVRFAVNDRLDIRAEYERFEFDKTDVDHLSAIIQYNF